MVPEKHPFGVLLRVNCEFDSRRGCQKPAASRVSDGLQRALLWLSIRGFAGNQKIPFRLRATGPRLHDVEHDAIALGAAPEPAARSAG